MIDKYKREGHPYEHIDSDYLTPEPHAHTVDIDIYIDVYSYIGGISDEYHAPLPPVYKQTLTGKVINANFTIDSTTDIRSTCSLEMKIYEDEFTGNLSNYIWSGKLLRIIKTYKYPNDKDLYDEMPDKGSQCVIGWFLPNDGSYSYNADTQIMTLSCTDIMSLMTDTRGGHLTIPGEYMWLWRTDLNDPSDDFSFVSYNGSSGVILEGEKNYADSFSQFPNYSMAFQYAQTTEAWTSGSGSMTVPVRWEKRYEEYIKNHPEFTENEKEQYFPAKKDKDEDDTVFCRNVHDGKKNDIFWLIQDLLLDWNELLPYSGIHIRLQNDNEGLPYTMEFNGDTTLYDVLKKIIELYPRQAMYFDSNLQLNFVQYALAWGEAFTHVYFKAREFRDIVLEEHWNKNYENVKNWVTVFGRENVPVGTYYLPAMELVCTSCGEKYDIQQGLAGNPTPSCPKCGGNLIKYDSNNPLAVERYGIHKLVLYNDSYLTDEECRNAAKYTVWENCRCAETLTVTLMDRYLSMYSWADKGVGQRIEYKSKITGETNLYTLVKWSNNFTDGTVTMELEPWYPIIAEYATTISPDGKTSARVLPEPEFTYTVDNSGNLELIITNGTWTSMSLFKVYMQPINNYVKGWDDNNDRTWTRDDFIGETCEIYSPETSDSYEKKIFRYKFKKSGYYRVKCQAWSPDIHPSGFSGFQIIEVNITDNVSRLISHDGQLLTLHDGSHILNN